VRAAAIADFRPAAERDGKLSRSASDRLTLELEATPDILAGLAAARPGGQKLVGFAAEHGAEGIDRARAKLERKQVDLIVYNDISSEGIGFDSPDNEVTLITVDGEQHIPRAPKSTIATRLIEAIEALQP
jgi:phosphopantothenoylcysteine decarboxylase/phosphopantothenate--cysteine ligase